MRPPVIGFSAYSGTGKTTVMEKVIRLLTDCGVRVGVIKHDCHGIDIDRPGKDSYRHVQAGAAEVLLASPEKTVWMGPGGDGLEMCLDRMENVDVVLVEGFKHGDIPRIGLCRKAAGKDFTEPNDHFIALVTDDETVSAPVPRFALDDYSGIADFIIKEMGVMGAADFTHFNDQGRARMVDVGEKAPTQRTATAAGRVLVNEDTFSLIRSGGVKKGDVLTVAQVAGIMAAKRTWELIPLCHPIALTSCDVEFSLGEDAVEVFSRVRCAGETGVEMEALAAASTAALTIYDMCKAVQRDMEIDQVFVLEKDGGASGRFLRDGI